MKYLVLALSLAVAVNAYTVPIYELNSAKKTIEPNGNLVELAQSLGLTTLIDAAVKAKIDNVLKNAPALTLFGPINEAFQRIPAPIRPLLANETLLKFFLLFHVLKGDVYSNAIKNELLVPSIIDSNPKFSIRFNIYENPTGTVVTAQCSKIIKVDQKATNGVIHVVENLMIPANDTIGNMPTNYPQYYSILGTALKKAGLDKVLNGDGPFTLLAPIDEAFAKIPPAQLKKILADLALLTKILKYHVVSGTRCVAGMYSGQEIPTLEGHNITVRFGPGVLTFNNAKAVYIDAGATNGVVQVIDTVLIPPGLEI